MGSTGGEIVQQAPTWKKPAAVVQWSDDPAERRRQSMVETDRTLKEHQAKVDPFQPSGWAAKAPASYYREGMARANEEYEGQSRARRLAAQAADEQARAETAAFNSEALKKYKGNRQQYYIDPASRRVVPVVEEGTGRKLFHESDWEPGEHPKDKRPVKVKIDRYGQRQFKDYPLGLSPDALDEHAYYDVGDGESVQGPSYKELLASPDVSMQRKGLAIKRRLEGAQASEAISQMEGAAAQVDREFKMAKVTAAASRMRADELSQKGGDPKEIERLYTEADTLDESVRGDTGPLALRKNMAEAALDEERSKLKRDQYLANRDEISARVLQRGGDVEADPTYRANEAHLAEWGGRYQNAAKLRSGVEQLMRPVGTVTPVAKPVDNGGTLKQTAKAVARGASAEGFYAATEGLSRLLERTAAMGWIPGMGPVPVGMEPAAKWYADATRQTRDTIRRALPVDQKFAQSKLGQIAQGAGQLIGNLPVAALGPGGIAAASVGQIYDEAYQDAVGSGATPEQAHSAAMKYLPAAGLDFLADRLVIGKLLKPLKGKMTVGQLLKDIFVTSGVEAGTEGAQQAYLNQIASKLEGYDPNRPFDQEVYDSALVGAVVGTGATTLGTGGRMALGRAGPGPTDARPVPKPVGPTDTPAAVTPVGPADAPVAVDAELSEVLGRAAPADAAATPAGNFPVGDEAPTAMTEVTPAPEGAVLPVAEEAAPAEAPVPVGTAEPLAAGEVPSPEHAIPPAPVAAPASPVTVRVKRKSGRWVDVTMTAEQAEAYRKKQEGAEPVAEPVVPVAETPAPPVAEAVRPAAPEAAGRPPTVEATPEQIAADRAEYDRLQAEMKTKAPLSPEYNALWQQAEDVKNRHGGFVPELISGQEPEKVEKVASRFRGKIYTGEHHALIASDIRKDTGLKLNMDDPLSKEVEDGFITSSGRFVSRIEALKIAREAGQVKRAFDKFGPPKDLLSEMMREDAAPAQSVSRPADNLPPSTPESLRPPAQMKRPELRAELEAAGVSTIAGKPLADASPARLMNAVGKLRSGKLTEDAPAASSLSERTIQTLKKAKISTQGKAFDVTAGLPIAAYNAALDLAIAAIKAGRSIAEAVRLAVARYRALHKEATDSDVAKLTTAIESAGASPEPTPTQDTTPAATQPTPSGQSFTGPVNPGAPEFRRRSKSALGEYEYVSTTNTGQEKYAQEFADWHEKHGTPESAIAEMRSINEPAFRATVAAELLARNLEAESTANEGDKVLINERINSLWGDVRAEKTEAAQALQAQALTNKKLEPYLPILMWKDLIRSRLEKEVGSKFGEDAGAKVNKGVKDAGDEAAGALKEALETPEGEKPKGKSATAVSAWLDKHAATLTLLRKAAKSRDLKWGDIFNSLPENQEARKAELFDRVKAEPKLKDLTEAQQKRLADSLDESWTFLRNQIFKREFSRLVQLPNVKPADAEKVKSAIGELLKYSNLGLLDNTAFLNALAEKYGLENMDGPTAKKLTDLAQKIQRAKNPAEKARAQLEMMDTFHAAKGIELKDILNSQLYANILSAYTTQLGGNIGGNIAQTVAGLTTTGLAEPTRVGALLKGWTQGMPEAWRQAQSIWSTGHGGQDAAALLAESKGDTFELMAKGEVFKQLNERLPKTAKSVQNYAKVMRYVSRFMRAADAMFYYPAREAYARVAAEKILEADYSGPELKAQVEKHLGVGIGDYEAAVAQAKNDGFTEKHEIARRASDIIEEKRGQSHAGRTALEQGKRFGGTVTLNKDPEGWWGVAYKHGVHFVDDFTPGGLPVAKPFMMFMRVPTNFINETLNYTPVGGIRAMQGDTGTTQKKDGKYQRREFTKEEQRRLIIQSMIGTSLIGYFASRALMKKPEDEEDPFDITATGPRDATQRAQWQAAGNIPYSIRIPGTKTRLNYQNTPLAMPLALAGHVADSVRYDNASEGKVGSATANMLMRWPSVILGIPMLQGLSELVEMTDQNRPNVSRTVNFFKNLGKNLVINRLVTQLHQAFVDDIVKDNGVIQYDSLGQPVHRKPHDRQISTQTDDPLRSFLDTSRIVIPVPDRNITVRGATHTLTPEELAEFRRKAGTLIRARLTSLLSALKAMPKEQAEERVKEVAREQIDRVREEIKRGIRRMPRIAPADATP